MKQLLISIAITACIAACSSGEGAGNVGGAAGSGTGGQSGGGGSGGSSAGGGSGGQCPDECFAPAECVHQCGEQPTTYGCCGCPPGMIDAHQCADDAGCHPPISDAGSITCGSTTCTPDQVCVFHCCGGAGIDSGTACKPAPPSCVDLNAINCSPCDGTSSCSAPTEGCSGMLVGQTLNCVCA